MGDLVNGRAMLSGAPRQQPGVNQQQSCHQRAWPEQEVPASEKSCHFAIFKEKGQRATMAPLCMRRRGKTNLGIRFLVDIANLGTCTMQFCRFSIPSQQDGDNDWGGGPTSQPPAFRSPPVDLALLEEFVLESSEALRGVEQDMLAIERGGAADPATMSRIFRAVILRGRKRVFLSHGHRRPSRRLPATRQRCRPRSSNGCSMWPPARTAMLTCRFSSTNLKRRFPT